MKRMSPISLVRTLCLGAALSLSMAAFADHPKKPQPAHSMSGHSAGSMELHRIMSQGHKMAMPMSGNVDKDFASMMTMHHQQAIKMADVLIRDGSNAELKAMARKMKAAQQAEITQMAPFMK